MSELRNMRTGAWRHQGLEVGLGRIEVDRARCFDCMAKDSLGLIINDSHRLMVVLRNNDMLLLFLCQPSIPFAACTVHPPYRYAHPSEPLA